MFAHLLSIFINVVTPVFGLVGIGYLFGPRLNLEVRTLSRVAYYVFVPAFVFHHIGKSDIALDQIAKVTFYIATVHTIGAISAYWIAIFFTRSRAKAAAFALIASFGNVGNFGVPIILFRLGESATATATLFFVVISMIAFIVGVGSASLIKGGTIKAVYSVFKTPAILALIPSLFFPLSGLEIPLMISRITELLAGAMVPVMLIAMGLSLAGSAKIKVNGEVLLASGIRLLFVPLLAFVLALLFGIGGQEKSIAILQAGMPAAVLTWLIAMEHDLIPDFVFSVLVFSTLGSLLTLTLLLAWV